MKKVSLNVASQKQFIESINAVMELCPPARLAYSITKNSKKIDEEIKLYDEQRIKSLKKYCKLDENGELARGQDGQAIFNEESGKDSFIKELSDLMAVEFECYELKLSDLNNVKDLKGTHVAVLFPIIDEQQ